MATTSYSPFHDLLFGEQENQRYWINNNYVDSEPRSVTNTDGTLNRSTYQWTRFYGFVTNPQGAVFIISDSALRLELKPDPNTKDVFELFVPGIEDSAAGKIKIVRKDLMFPICLKVSDTDAAGELPPGTYVPMTKEPEPPKTDPKQQWGDIFTGRAPSFHRVLTPYDLTRISFENLEDSQTSHFVFAQPRDESRAYRLVSPGGESAYPIPYGWRLFPVADSISKSQTTFLSSGKDVNISYSKTVGAKAGINILGLKIGGSAGHTNTKMYDNMYNQELTYSETTYLDLSHALVLDKANVELREKLRQSIFQLREDSNFEDFLSKFGTHYAYATTFGKRGYQRNSMTKKDVLNIHEAHVDAKEALEIGMTMNVEGMSGGVDLGMSNEDARGLVKKLSSAVSSEISEIHRVGYGDGAWPVLLDLRPISDLLGPPFYDNWEIAVELRDELSKRIEEYCFSKDDQMHKPSTQFLSIRLTEAYVSFSPPRSEPPLLGSQFGTQLPVNSVFGQIDSVTLKGAGGRLLTFVLDHSQPPPTLLDTAAGDIPLTADIKWRDKITGKQFGNSVKLVRMKDFLMGHEEIHVVNNNGDHQGDWTVFLRLTISFLSGAEVLNGEAL